MFICSSPAFMQAVKHCIHEMNQFHHMFNVVKPACILSSAASKLAGALLRSLFVETSDRLLQAVCQLRAFSIIFSKFCNNGSVDKCLLLQYLDAYVVMVSFPFPPYQFHCLNTLLDSSPQNRIYDIKFTL